MVKKETKMTILKFHPPLRPRFFFGEVTEGERWGDFQCYKEHRLRCARAVPKIDNKAPRFDLDVYHRYTLMNEDARVAKFHYQENLSVAKKINTVARLGGKVDCWNLKDKKRKTDQDLMKMDYRRMELENKALYKKLCSLTSQLSPEVMAKEWKLVKQSIIEKSRFPWFKQVSRYPSITTTAIGPSEPEKKRPRCFFDLELDSSHQFLGRLVFELYTDYVPSTCANFEAFCRGFNGLSYKGTPLHRILSDYYCQGGDVTKFNGTGGASIYEEASTRDENLSLSHACPGVLSTFSDNKSSLDSKFHLSFRPLKTMDGRHVVFGKVVKGLPNLFKVNAYGSKYGRPLQKVIVANCGVLPLTNNNSRRGSNQSQISNRSK